LALVYPKTNAAHKDQKKHKTKDAKDPTIFFEPLRPGPQFDRSNFVITRFDQIARRSLKVFNLLYLSSFLLFFFSSEIGQFTLRVLASTQCCCQLESWYVIFLSFLGPLPQDTTVDAFTRLYVDCCLIAFRTSLTELLRIQELTCLAELLW